MQQRTLQLSGANKSHVLGHNNYNITLLTELLESTFDVSIDGSLLTVSSDDHICLERVASVLSSIITKSKGRKTPFRKEEIEKIVAGLGTGENKCRAKGLKLNSDQQRFMEAFQDHDLIFAVGPAGSGKTMIAVYAALQALQNGDADRLIITRPAVSSDEDLGALPGTLQDKVDPFMRPIFDELSALTSAQKVVKYIEKGIIEITAVGFLRGRTIRDRVIAVVDESQNLTVSQMKMVLTRLGRGGKLMITGDPSQTDLPARTPSGLSDAIKRLKHVDEVAIILFHEKNIMRHDLVQKIVECYEQ